MSSLLPIARRGRASDPEPEDTAGEDLPPIAPASRLAAAHFGAKAATVGLMSCLVLAPIGAVAGGAALLQSSSPPPPAVNTAATDLSNERAVAGEFAQRLVTAWLTTARARPEPLLALVEDAQVAVLPEQPFNATDPAVAGIVRVGDIWSVTVAVTVTDARDMTERRFYQVPVQVRGAAVTAITLPATVSAPVVEAPPRTGYRYQLNPVSAAGVTVTQFLAAYTAGAGDVSRYLTPGTALSPLTPAAYTDIRLDDLRSDADISGDDIPRDGQRIRVLAQAVATVTPKQAVSVTYALTLTARASRWEITAIDPVPVLAPQAARVGERPAPTAAANSPTGTPPAATP